MKIKFCGASIGVTGSCHLITTDKHKLLLDCGQFQGGKAVEKQASAAGKKRIQRTDILH